MVVIPSSEVPLGATLPHIGCIESGNPAPPTILVYVRDSGVGAQPRDETWED